MPEIDSTMYPIIIAGAVAVLVLLLLLVAARRRRARPERSAEEHDTAVPGAEEDSPGVRLIENDDSHGDNDEARAPAAGNGRVADGTEISTAAAGSPGETEATESSVASAAGSHPTGSRSGSLVAWGPDETGPEAQGRQEKPSIETPTGVPSEAGTRAPPTASHATVDAAAASGPPDESEAESQDPPGTPLAESDSAAATEPPPGAGTGHPEQEPTDPEGQPFERDGQWWFRRDGELLVYDDTTSEWKAALQAASPDPEIRSEESAADVDKAAHGEALRKTSATATIEKEANGFRGGPLRPRSEGATSWKCRTCGATNGSSAGSCRMCFAARP